MFSVKVISCFILTFSLSMVMAPIIVRIIRKIGIKQTTLIYVEKHEYKNGTPTMGGIIFILPTIIIGLIYSRSFSISGSIAIYVMFAYSLIGFLDDFIKVKFSQNLGLRAYQKIIAQLGIAIIVSFYCYNNSKIGSIVNIPFFNATVNLGWFYIPFTMLIYIATTNAVNLTDGLDGLATKTAIAYLSTFLLILFVVMYDNLKINSSNFENDSSLIFFVSSLLGSLFAFLWLNCYPAKIFMGDTGSLAIGGAIASVSVFSKNPFLILIIGIMYVVSCISVILQVVVYKLTKKRIFKMAPLHHHLEYKGIKESKIVSYYTIITIICGVIALYDFFI